MTQVVHQGCVIEIEGKKRGRYSTFSVVDPSGLNLLRMSSENDVEAGRWVAVCRHDQTCLRLAAAADVVSAAAGRSTLALAGYDGEVLTDRR